MASSVQHHVNRLIIQLRWQLAKGVADNVPGAARDVGDFQRCGILSRRLLTTKPASLPSEIARDARDNVQAGFSVRRLIQDYKQLSKFKLSSLVVLTASAGFVAASGDVIDYQKLAWTCLGTFGAAACANTLNQVWSPDTSQAHSFQRGKGDRWQASMNANSGV